MKQTMEEVHLTTIKPRNEVLLLAQEISFAKVLSCNDKRLRDRGIRRLKKWFMARSQGQSEFTKDDFMRIWKGLFYCMWMSDKPLVQEELAEQISHLIHSFASFKASLLFVETFYASLSVEWFGIDQLRLDKFMMLVRRFMRQSLELVARLKWPEKQTQKLADVYLQSLKTAPLGLSMHIIEVFCEELAKIGKGELASSTILQFITVFARHLATLKDGRMISQITRYVFLHLIRQSELGVEHQMKFSAWKEYGFPGGDLDAAERVDEPESDDEMLAGSEDDAEEERLTADDARAGKVDVVLPPLDFDYRDLLKVLRDLRNSKETTTKARKTLMQLILKYEHLAKGKYPLGLHKIDLAAKIDKKKEITQAAKRIVIEEEKLMNNESETDESDSEKVPLAKKTAKKLAKKKLQSNWKVSKVNVSNNHKESGSNSSWDVCESNSNDSPPNSANKRKINDNKVTSDNSNKKLRKSSSSISVSDSKENNSSSPVASTPKITNKSNILKKATSNDQNVSSDNASTPNTNKSKKKVKKNVTTSTSMVNDKVEQKAGTSLGQEDLTNNTPNKRRKSSRNSKAEGETVIILKESDKNNGWGGEWDAPADDVAYELFVPNKKYVEKRKSQGLSYPVSSIIENSAEKTTPMASKDKSSTPGSQKKVEFNLSANCSQEYKEYARKLKSKKSDVAFDSSKKPSQGLLKSFTPSPINPFYRKKLKFLTSPKNSSFS